MQSLMESLPFRQSCNSEVEPFHWDVSIPSVHFSTVVIGFLERNGPSRKRSCHMSTKGIATTVLKLYNLLKWQVSILLSLSQEGFF